MLTLILDISIMDLWCQLYLPKPSYDKYMNQNNLDDIYNKYFNKFIFWLAWSLKQINQKWNMLLKFTTLTSTNTAHKIQSQFGTSVSLSTHHRNRRSVIKNYVLLKPQSVPIIWIDNFSKMLKHSYIRANKKAFDMNCWTITAQRLLSSFTGPLDYTQHSLLPLPLTTSLVDFAISSLTWSYNDKIQYHHLSNSLELNVNSIPLKFSKSHKYTFIIFL